MAFTPTAEQLSQYWGQNPDALSEAIKANPSAFGFAPPAPTLTEQIATLSNFKSDPRAVQNLLSNSDLVSQGKAYANDALGGIQVPEMKPTMTNNLNTLVDLQDQIEAATSPEEIAKIVQGADRQEQMFDMGGRPGKNMGVDLAVSNLGADSVEHVGGDRYTVADLGLNEKDTQQYLKSLEAQGLIPDSGGLGYETHRTKDGKLSISVDMPERNLAADLFKTVVTTGIGAGFGSAATGLTGLTGVYGGAASGAANAAAQGAIRGDLSAGDVLKGAALGGATAVGGDYIKDIVSEAVDPATGARATTSDLGGLVGEKGLFSGIPEVDITGVRGVADRVGDFFFGPNTNQEWATLADGTRLTPDADGFLSLPDGSRMHMVEAMQTPGITTSLQKAGQGGLLSPLTPALDAFNTAFTPIADKLATAIVGENPWHDERLTFDERLSADRSFDAISNSIYRELPAGMTGNYPSPSKEEQEASEPLVVGPQPTQEEAEQIVEDLIEGDDELILGPGARPSTGEDWFSSPSGETGGEEIVQGEEEDTFPSGGDALPDGDNEDTFPSGGNNFPNPDPETVFTTPEDPVGQTQTLPPGGGGGGGGSAVAAERARRKLKEGDPELFRLARIMQVEGLPQSVYEAALGRINGILAGREGSDYEGDVTREIDPLSGRYIQRVQGERGETRRRAMLRELKEKERTT